MAKLEEKLKLFLFNPELGITAVLYRLLAEKRTAPPSNALPKETVLVSVLPVR